MKTLNLFLLLGLSTTAFADITNDILQEKQIARAPVAASIAGGGLVAAGYAAYKYEKLSSIQASFDGRSDRVGIDIYGRPKVISQEEIRRIQKLVLDNDFVVIRYELSPEANKAKVLDELEKQLKQRERAMVNAGTEKFFDQHKKANVIREQIWIIKSKKPADITLRVEAEMLETEVQLSVREALKKRITEITKAGGRVTFLSRLPNMPKEEIQRLTKLAKWSIIASGALNLLAVEELIWGVGSDLVDGDERY